MLNHDDVIKWKHFPRNWPFVQGIHRSNNREAGDLRHHRAHYNVIVKWGHSSKIWGSCDVNARGVVRRNRSRVYTTWKLSATCNGHGFMVCLATTHGVSWLTSIKTMENTVEPLYETNMFVKNTQKRLWGRGAMCLLWVHNRLPLSCQVGYCVIINHGIRRFYCIPSITLAYMILDQSDRVFNEG